MISRQVLICESHRETHAQLVGQLNTLGYRTISAFSGQEALEQAASGAPDLILLSLLFPDVDGLAVLRKLRQQEKTAAIPILALSSAASAGSVEARLASLNVAGILRKPIAEAELLVQVSRIFAEVDAAQTKRYVLVVDDGNLPRRLLETAFQAAGCQSLCVDSFAIAQSLLDTLHPEAVIIAAQGDLEEALPLVESLATDGALRIPVLGIAGVLRPETFARLTRLGVRDILVTPVPLGRLWRAVARLLPTAPGVEFSGKSVLLVEDAVLVAKMLAALLEEDGFQVTQARSAEDALGIIRQSPPELMLLDLVLPGIDGVQLVQQLHQANLRVPFAVVTAATQPDKLRELEGLGVMKVFEKPIHSEDLRSFVQGFFARAARGAAASC
jgi:CheY-like chemotaxis protein